MLLKFRKRLLRWFRDSDDYDGNGNYLYDNQVEAAPEPDYNIKVARQQHKNRGGLAIANMTKNLVSKDRHDVSQQHTISFSVTSGHGGIVIETRQYNDRAGDNESQLYIIPEDQDLAAEITKIITLQSLRH
jgi:hypothetical protein